MAAVRGMRGKAQSLLTEHGGERVQFAGHFNRSLSGEAGAAQSAVDLRFMPLGGLADNGAYSRV